MTRLSDGQRIAVQQARTDIESGIDQSGTGDVFSTTLDPGGNGRYNQDYLPRPGFAAWGGEVGHVVGYQQSADSNLFRVVIGGEVEIAYHLLSDFGEPVWVDGVFDPPNIWPSPMDDILLDLLDRNYWLGRVRRADDVAPIERSPIERTGSVIHFTFDLQISINITGL